MSISDRRLIVGFLMFWLKWCIVSSIPQDATVVEVVYSAILLAHRKPLGLLLAMVCKLQNGLLEHTTEFCPGGKKKKKSRGTESEEKMPTPNPRVELPYTYLTSWSVLHCLSLITSSLEDSSGGSFIQRHKGCE